MELAGAVAERSRLNKDLLIALAPRGELWVDSESEKAAFGFARYPETLNDSGGNPLLKIPVAGRWHFSGVIKSPDPRYRQIVKRFAAAGYLEAESDHFAQ